MGQPLCCSAADGGRCGERVYGDGSTHYVTQQYRLASVAAWLSSTGISYHNLLLHISSVCLSAISSSPLPWDCSTILELQLPAAVPSRGSMSLSGVCMAAARTAFHLGCHRSAVSLSALNVSPLTQLPGCGNWTPASVSPPTNGGFQSY